VSQFENAHDLVWIHASGARVQKLENHEYAVALNFFNYNPPSSIPRCGCCPCLGPRWTYEELVEMIDWA